MPHVHLWKFALIFIVPFLLGKQSFQSSPKKVDLTPGRNNLLGVILVVLSIWFCIPVPVYLCLCLCLCFCLWKFALIFIVPLLFGKQRFQSSPPKGRLTEFCLGRNILVGVILVFLSVYLWVHVHGLVCLFFYVIVYIVRQKSSNGNQFLILFYNRWYVKFRNHYSTRRLLWWHWGALILHPYNWSSHSNWDNSI